MIADADGAALRGYLATRGGRTTIRVGRSFEDIPTGRSGIITSFSSAGPDRLRARAQAGRRRAGRRDPLVDAAELRRAVRRLRRHEHGGAARRRARPRCSCERHPSWTPHQIKSALMSTAGPAWGDTARTQEASVLLEGAGLINVQAADSPLHLHRPGLALVRRHQPRRRRGAAAAAPHRPGRGRRRRDVERRPCSRSRRATGRRSSAPGRHRRRRAGRRR